MSGIDSKRDKLMPYKNIINSLKVDSFEEALSISVPVYNSQNLQIGSLVPVGNWILSDEEKICNVRDWRQKTMRMFLTQFQSTFEGTFSFLKNLFIGQEDRILFLIYDEHKRFIGHIGMVDINAQHGELDNLMRGVDGGNPRLVYFSEITLLDWCFKKLGIGFSDVRALSYNWVAISLHEEVGYVVTGQIPLSKREKDGVVFHDYVKKNESNVRYSCIRMMLEKDNFYKKAWWLKKI